MCQWLKLCFDFFVKLRNHNRVIFPFMTLLPIMGGVGDVMSILPIMGVDG